MRVFSIVVIVITWLSFACPAGAIEVAKDAGIQDTDTSIMGVNHIGLSVKNLDKVLEFYQQATEFELVRRDKVASNTQADTLYGHDDIAYEIAVLKAPNMLFELIEFKHNESATIDKMPAQGPGMTHTCFQSSLDDPGYDKFIKAGAARLSRGLQPVDLGGYGVTYAYVYDPEGNMLELEQLDAAVLARSGYDEAWQDIGESMWMSQVALVSHDIESLMQFYQMVLGIKPYRFGEVKDNAKADDIVDVDDVSMQGGWFRMNQASKVLEIWQYISPETEKFQGSRDVTDLGYSFSLEVSDIKAEHQRLSAAGVEFFSEPVQLGDFWQVFARDPDGNIFSLRQILDVDSRFSVKQMDALKVANKGTSSGG